MTKRPGRTEGSGDGLVVERPDGFFYWRHPRTGKEYGPFATSLEALGDMNVEESDPASPKTGLP